jgi:hypothetical protein
VWEFNTYVWVVSHGSGYLYNGYWIKDPDPYGWSVSC